MQVQVRRSDGRIVQIGNGLGERDGADIVDISDETAEAIREAMAQPNGGITLIGDVVGILPPVVLPPPPPPPDYGDDIPSDFDSKLSETVANIRAYLSLPAPTNAQTIAVIKLLCRVVLWQLRRSVA